MSFTHRAGVTGIVPEHWAQQMQVPLRKSMVSSVVANTRWEPTLRDGDTIHFSYYDDVSVVDYVPGQDIEDHDQLTATDETLVVNQSKIARVYVDNVEELQTRPDQMQHLIESATYKIADNIDTNVFLNVTGAASSLDDGDIGGNAGSAIDSASGNVIDIFASAREKMRRMNVEEVGDMVVVAPPKLIQRIEEKAADSGFSVSDATLRNGFVGNWFGFDWYVSNNLPTEEYGGTDNTVNAYIGRRGMIDLVTQMTPRVIFKEVPNRLGQYMYVHTLYGTGLFEKSKHRFLAAKIAP